jgi:selenocysteine-specific translation elongation factor
MYVIATAGHVDHGKSALLRALTGMEPDRWEEERRRGLTIDLGFGWTQGATGSIRPSRRDVFMYTRVCTSPDRGNPVRRRDV